MKIERDVKSSNFSENLMFILNVWNPAWQMLPAKILCRRAERSVVQRTGPPGLTDNRIPPLDMLEACGTVEAIICLI